MPRRQLAESPDRRSWPTKSLFQDYSLDWVSTIPMKSARFGRSCQRLVPKERLPPENETPTRIMVPVESFSDVCRKMWSRRSVMEVQTRRSARWRQPQNLVHSSYRCFSFAPRCNFSRKKLICSGVMPQHPPISCTLKSCTHTLTNSL